MYFFHRCKFTKPSDVVTGNPLVLRMVVNYSRQMSSQNALRDVVGPLILQVIKCNLRELFRLFIMSYMYEEIFIKDFNKWCAWDTVTSKIMEEVLQAKCILLVCKHK